jgi:hypothetical protein
VPENEHYAASEIEKVEPAPRAGWVVVTLRERDGQHKRIMVRKGSSFANRPTLSPAG